jgi:hypothetical protein
VHYVHYITPSLSRIVDPATRFLFNTPLTSLTHHPRMLFPSFLLQSSAIFIPAHDVLVQIGSVCMQ